MIRTIWAGLTAGLLLGITGCSQDSPPAANTPATNAPAAPASSVPAIPSVPTAAKEYPLKEVGALRLAVPTAWQDSFKMTLEMGSRVDELKFQPRDGSGFAILVDAIHLDDPRSVQHFDTASSVIEAVDPELKNAVEQKPEVHNFTGAEITGSYTQITDKTISPTAPKPGEYKYLVQGYAKLSPVILMFRLVSNQPDGPEKAALIEMVKSAHLTPAQ